MTTIERSANRAWFAVIVFAAIAPVAQTNILDRRVAAWYDAVGFCRCGIRSDGH
jgi:hypothetical protein